MIETTVKLLALRTPISNGALKADKLPDRLKLLGWGENQSVKGPVRVSELSASLMAANQRGRGFEEIALDFEHNTVPGSPEYERSQEPRKVAAYGTPRIVPGEGLILENLRWTPSGQSDALNFADLSPAVEMDAQGNIVFVHSAALTRNGAVDGLSFFSVQLKTQNHSMDLKNILLVEDLAPVLGLNATASKADVLGKLQTLCLLSALINAADNKLTAFGACPVKDGKLALPDITGFDARLKTVEGANNDKILTLSATIEGKTVTLKPEEVVGRIIKLEGVTALNATAAETRERGELISRFSAEGKVPKGTDGKELTDEQLKTFSVDSIKLLLANTPATVPLSARGKRPTEKQGGELKGLAKAIQEHNSGN